MPSLHPWFDWLVILVTLTGVAVGRYPVLRMNRATIALVGATVLTASGGLTLEQAYGAIDLDTLVLLLGMMILNANLRLAGFFNLAAHGVVRAARSPRHLLALVIFSSGILAALFLNDTVVLVMTPLVLETTLLLGLPPVPYLVALAMAANIGSVATIIGNPQNMMIGMASGLPFLDFAAREGPVALVGLGLAWGVCILVYGRELNGRTFSAPELPPPRLFLPLLRKSLAATLLLLIALIGGMPIPLAALGSASLLLITRRIKPERVFREIDWGLLVFFAGLFVVTGAVERSGAGGWFLDHVGSMADHGAWSLTALAAVLSNLISNVPAVLLLGPVVESVGGGGDQGWLLLAMATTLAGNLTLLGSVCNLIVAENARQRGVTLSFLAYLKAGVPVTLLTLGFGVFWLEWTR